MPIEPLSWPSEGNSRVPYRVFADPDIDKTELDRLFLGPTWQFLALAEELPDPGGHEHGSQETRATEASIRGFWQAYRPLMGL
jgi:hypothetical protein